jgi:tetratricopeptide (TPR) repeat protein
MRYLWSCCQLLLCVSLLHAVGPTLREARQRWLHGNYEEARARYEELAKHPGQAVPALIGLSRAWQSQGEYDRALEVLDEGLKNNAKSADLLARRAELLHLRGRWTGAMQAAEQALALKPEHFLARWVRAQIALEQADFKRADAELRWFVRTYTVRSNKDADIKDPEELRLVALAGAENARWHNLSDQFRVILTDVLGDAIQNDKDFWPAEYQAGALLLEKYNRPEALDAFDRVLTINSSAAEALVGKGTVALQRFDLKEAEQFAERALRINPHLPEALHLHADCHLFAGNLKACRGELERARQINPRDEKTLGRLGACLLLVRDQRGFDRLVGEVRQWDPKPGVFYYELGEQLEARRQFEAAEKYYKTAMEQRPMLPGPQNSLGLLYMRMGREDEARTTLTKAFDADEFNVLVSNTLKVLRHLDKFQTLQTEHFRLRFNPATDARLARFMTPYLEEIYADLAGRFRYRPAQPILVEVFDTHDMFSGRVTALPDLHTVGASTGRLIALVSPHGEGLSKPFNWVRVLRHELVHVFNLEQTHFQVPHWFTEGLAVLNEGYPRPQIWNELLRQRVPTGDLLNLDTIELGFIRPRSPLDWNMAYCQSELYIDYLREKFGPKSVAEFLAAYRDGLDTDAALTKVCGVDRKTFEEGYRGYVNDVVRALQGRPPEKPLTFSELRKAHEAEPKNPEIAARLAEQYFVRHDRTEARKLVEAVLAKKPTQPLATYVKARLLLDAGDDEKARPLLEAALDRQAPEPKVVQFLGKLYFEAREFAKAAELYELAHRVEPYESKWLVELARVYTQMSDRDKRIGVLKQLVAMDADDLDQRKRLSQMLLEASRTEEAERYARQALEIDVRDAEAEEMLQRALREQDKTEEAERVRRLLANPNAGK